MTARIGINGMGRIGRLALRAVLGGVRDYVLAGKEALDIVHVNEVAGDAATTAHLLEFDSVHGRWREQITADENSIRIGDTRMGHASESIPGDVAWEASGIDIVLECTGKFRTLDNRTLCREIAGQMQLQPYLPPTTNNIIFMNRTTYG
jgi:glyceraldehyde 3-phosphate dehydrogenase